MTQSVAAQMIKPNTVGWTSTTAEARAAAKADARDEIRTAGRTPTSSESGGGFLDFLATVIDVINPLQHIPVVSSIYRQLTGDEISGPARIAGGALYGGPLGGALAVADAAYAQQSGGYAGDTALAALTGSPTPTPANTPDPDVMLADASPQNTQPSYFHTASLSVPTPTPARTATGETATARDSDTPVIRQPAVEQTAAAFRPSQGNTHSTRPKEHILTAQMLAGSSAFLPDAPAESRTGLPPELMAMKMQEALDKYAAMKVRGL